MTASTALTVTKVQALTVTTAPVLERVYVKRARSTSEIIDRIRDASACLADIGLFLRDLGPQLDKNDLQVVNYAMARARYRENLDLSIEHVALLTEMTVEKVRRYFKRLQIQIGDRIANQQVSALLTAVAEY